MSPRPNISIQVIPAGAPVYVSGGFMLLGYVESADLVYVDAWTRTERRLGQHPPEHFVKMPVNGGNHGRCNCSRSKIPVLRAAGPVSSRSVSRVMAHGAAESVGHAVRRARVMTDAPSFPLSPAEKSAS
jgi:hypothetical protein